MFQSDVLRSQWPVTQRREFISSGCSQGMLFRDTPQKNLLLNPNIWPSKYVKFAINNGFLEKRQLKIKNIHFCF